MRPFEPDTDLLRFEESETAGGAKFGTKGIAITEVASESDTLITVNIGGSEGTGINAGATANAFVRVSQLGPGSRAGIDSIGGANGLAGGI